MVFIAWTWKNKRFIEGECRIWTNIIKKEVFIRNKIEFPEELFYEDNAIVTALYLSARKIVKDTHPYYYYRCNNISTTRSINNYRFFDRLKTSKMFLDNMRRLGIYEIYPEEVEFRFTELFYVNSILGAISHLILLRKSMWIKSSGDGRDISLFHEE